FRDTTRIASSNADMWADICLTNVDAIVDGLANLQAMLSGVAEAAQQGNRPLLYEFFRAAKVRRDALLSASLSPNGNL
ncbi:MAG TPA: prephenate dehydrogenase dimerization domain-containing protein, partial [Negativicutes bacterium]